MVSEDAGRGWLGTVHAVLTRPAAAWLLLGIGLLATLLASAGAWWQIRSRDEARFFADTEALRNGLVQEFDRYVRLLNGARALWGIHPPVVRDEWRYFAESMDLSASFPGLQALGYVERVPAARLPGFVEEVRRAESRDRDVSDFQVHPRASGDEHYVVRFVEPLGSNRPALGYDIRSDPIRRQAAEQARDTGQATLTHKLTLLQAPQAPGVLLLLPVYGTGLQATNLAMRRASLRGWVYAAFVVEDLLARVHRLGSQDLEMQVFDGTGMTPTAQLAGHRNRPTRGAGASRVAFERVARLDCGSTVWTLRFQAGPRFSQTHWLSAPGYVSASALGLCISALVFGIARSLAGTRQRAQALANEMTAQLRLQHDAMASAKNGIFILDATRDDCPIIYANPAFERMTGYGVDESLGDDTRHLLRSGAIRTRPPDLRAVLEAGGRERAVLREYRRNGSPCWVEFRLLSVLDDLGRRTHFLGIAEDVTEHKRAEEQLARAEQRYHELVDNLSVGVYRNTPGEQGRFVEVNPALVAMFDAGSKEELKGCSVSDLYVNPAQRKEVSERLNRHGFARDMELELKTLRGRRFWASVTATMKTDGEGTGFFDGVIVDVTERKQAEEELRLAYRELSRSQATLKATVQQLQASHEELQQTQLQLIQAAKLESVGSLAAGVAHEVKNPLQTILMGLEYLSRNVIASDETVVMALNDMREAVQRANRIIQELLQLSAARDFDLKDEDLSAVLERSLWLVNHEVVASQATVVRQWPQSLPRVPIDPGKIEQVLINLFINALQAMPAQGTLTVATRTGCLGVDLPPLRVGPGPFRPGEPLVVVEVHDTGPGIPESQLARVFDPFFTTKPVGVGTGLGLSVVKKIMDLHDGAIAIQNAPEGGTRVTLVFRVQPRMDL